MASIDDLWLVDFGDAYPGEPAHKRPALIVGPAPTFGRGLPFVVVCPLTTTFRDIDLHIEVEPVPSSGLHETCYIQCEQIRMVNRRRLVHHLGFLDPALVDEVRSQHRMLLDL